MTQKARAHIDHCTGDYSNDFSHLVSSRTVHHDVSRVPERAHEARGSSKHYAVAH